MSTDTDPDVGLSEDERRDALAAVVAEVLAAHSPFAVADPNSIYSVDCGCTFGPDRDDLPQMSWLQWNDHVATAVAARLADLEARATVAEAKVAACGVLADEWAAMPFTDINEHNYAVGAVLACAEQLRAALTTDTP